MGEPTGSADRRARCTVVYVAYRTPRLDLDWIDDGTEVIVVHNDEVMADASDERLKVINIRPGDNVGFGHGVNLAANHATGRRLLVCNPDTELDSIHFETLCDGPANQITAIPLVDDDGTIAPVTNSYPTPVSWLALYLRLGSLAPLGSRRRRLLGPLTAFGRSQRDADPITTPRTTTDGPAVHVLRDRWVSGAVFSIDRGRFLDVEGFSDRFFLYYEDVDLCERLGQRFPDQHVVVAPVAPGYHAVGGSAADAHSVVETIRRTSALEYASGKRGAMWRLAAFIGRAVRR